jgi:hypothetical protein
LVKNLVSLGKVTGGLWPLFFLEFWELRVFDLSQAFYHLKSEIAIEEMIVLLQRNGE